MKVAAAETDFTSSSGVLFYLVKLIEGDLIEAFVSHDQIGRYNMHSNLAWQGTLKCIILQYER